MAYAAQETEHNYKVGLVDTGSGKKTRWERARTATDRTDQNDKFTGDIPEQVFEFVAPSGSSVIGVVQHEVPQGGNSLTFTIESGNTNGDFTVNSIGELTRTPGHTLTGSYVLLISYTEGAPLFRSGSTQVTITVDE